MTVEAIKSVFEEYGHYIPYAYLGIISLIAIIMTVSDKNAARCGRSRVPEASLWTVALLGGSVMMYTTMKIIRHKTKHISFMIGLPITIILQFAAAFAFFILI